MQVLSPRVVTALNNLPGFPLKPSTSSGTPQAGQFILGTYLEEIRVRPGVISIPNLPLVNNALGDVRLVVDEQAWFMWDGTTWVSISGSSSSGVDPAITGQVTTGLVVGEVCYASAPNTWQPARADGTLAQATSVGLFNGTAGTILLSGSSIIAMRCTTDGGEPSINGRLYLANASADGGTGLGKVTATPPTPPVGGSVHLQFVGTCVSAANYAAFKVVTAVFQPSFPVVLLG